MPVMDTIQNAFSRFVPEKRGSIPLQQSTTGIGNGHVPFDDDMIVPKTTIVFHSSQAFFNFLALCCFASAASFQARNHVGPSGLSGFALFIAVIGILFPLFLLLTPVIYEKYDKGARLARALRELRVAFILTGTGTAVSLLIAFITTISAWTQPGCKNPDNDPHADLGDDFKKGLDGFCNTKKAGAVFFWLAFAFWVCSLVMTILDWRNGKTTRPRDPPFTHPEVPSDLVSQEDEESLYRQPSQKSTYNDRHDSSDMQSPFADDNRYSSVPSINPSYNSSVPSYQTAPSGAPQLPRPSIDAYGAFSDPPPSGFGASVPVGYSSGGTSSPTEGPRVSRTMQYADPYAAVRATVTSSQGQGVSAPPQSSYAPPYGGYR
ncbi:hypothetical protein K474DRAFT_1666339 [Panus rudis PR-1116 ss-1]|nr:hypothetical protein K474DRAFT_1666339 [Panus rudis PR-1116 ss-1]